MTSAFDPAVLDALGVPARRLCTDSREVRANDVFVACPGLRSEIGRAHV